MIFLIQAYSPGYYSQLLITKNAEWLKVVGFFALFIGIYSLVYHHVMKIRRKAPKWQYSIITLVAMVAMAVTGFVVGMDEGAKSYSDDDFAFQKWYLYVLAPLESTMFSLLAFYMASAAARAFRARNLEATLLLISAVLVMLAQVTIGKAIWDFIPYIGEWVYNFPTTASNRAILIGVGLGGCATSLKILLGIERSYLGMK